MQIRVLNQEDAKRVYEEHMLVDFPEDELKPFASIATMMAQGIYEPLAVWEGGRMIAYAWQTILQERRGALIDYYAVAPDLRGTGVGTRVLAAVAGYYAGRKDTLIIECEHPSEAPDPGIAKRRIGFYLRAGARATAMESRVFGVRYQIYALPCGENEPDTEINKDLKAIYKVMIPEPYYRGNVIFFGE